MKEIIFEYTLKRRWNFGERKWNSRG